MLRLLALDTSAVAASCAVVGDGGALLAEGYVRAGGMHSRTLMPMVGSALTQAGVSPDELTAIAVTVGPGSFTGVRIGVAAAKGLAFARRLPVAAVSATEAMAYNFHGLPGQLTVCAVMDARCRQLYTACFSLEDGALTRRTPDEALTMEETLSRLQTIGGRILLVGDGAAACYAEWSPVLPGLTLAPEALRFPRAAGVAAAALPCLLRGETADADTLLPLYLRLPQAERELRARQAAQM